MPRFFFRVIDDLDTNDCEGADLPDIGAARQHALHAARSIMCETMVADSRITLHHRIEIQDEQRAVVDTISFGDAVEIER